MLKKFMWVLSTPNASVMLVNFATYVESRLIGKSKPPIPRDVDELKARITEAVATIDNAMLGRVWQEFDYRLDVCRVTSGAHIEHL